MVNNDDRIAVWFSAGAASAVAAKLTVEKYAQTCSVRVINNPVAEEDSDNRRFLSDVENWIGVPIEIASNPAYPNASAAEIWQKRRYMSGVGGAICTVELKKRARQHWESQNRVDWHVLGFVAEEKHRHDRFVLTERENVLPILIEHNYSKVDCYAEIQKAGIKLPAIYRMGYPNANCIGCVKASSPTYWNHVRKQHPAVFEQRAALSRELGVRLVRVNNNRVFLDELRPSDIGKPMKNMDFECGIFCMEDAN